MPKPTSLDDFQPLPKPPKPLPKVDLQNPLNRNNEENIGPPSSPRIQPAPSNHPLPLPKHPMKVPSDTTPGLNYKPTTDPPFCQCRDFVHRGGKCKHIMRLEIMDLLKENKYLKTRYERESDSFFHSFESLMAHYNWKSKPDWEVDYLANLFLNVLRYDGESTVDPLHYIVNE